MRLRPSAAPVLALALCMPLVAAEMQTREEFAMGSRLRLMLEGGVHSEAVNRAVAVVHELEAVLSTWRPDSALSRLNAGAVPGEWVEVPESLCRITAESRRYAQASGGALDPTVHPLIELWGFETDSPRVPSRRETRRTVKGVGINHVEAECGPSPRLRFLRPGVKLNFGALGKGFAMDRLREALEAAGYHRGAMEFGRSWLVWGYTEEAPFHVEISHPAQPGRTCMRLALTDGALASSSQKEQYFVSRGKSYGHVLDPRTGRPVPSGAVWSIHAAAPSATQADALSTALFVMGETQGRRMLRSFPEAGAIWIMKNGTAHMDGSIPRTKGQE